MVEGVISLGAKLSCSQLDHVSDTSGISSAFQTWRSEVNAPPRSRVTSEFNSGCGQLSHMDPIWSLERPKLVNNLTWSHMGSIKKITIRTTIYWVLTVCQALRENELPQARLGPNKQTKNQIKDRLPRVESKTVISNKEVKTVCKGI